MATVCVGCGLTVDEEGKLIVEVAPGTDTQRNELECAAEGLTSRQRRKTLRRHFTGAGALAIASDVGPNVGRALNAYVTAEDNGSAAGLWTVNADGSVTINVEGVYLVSMQTILEGSTGQVVGGRARVIQGDGSIGNIICSTEINDKNHVIDLAYPNDGPEFNATAVRHLAVDTELKYLANAYLDVVGQGIDWAGEFTLTYLGEYS